ncbi:MAG: POTRA domain-containing protein, partial [Bacteroidota bacterium]
MKKSFYYTFLIQLIMGYMLPTGALAQPTPQGQPLELDYEAPNSYLIEDIQVTGTQALDKEAIVALVGLKIGDTVSLPGPAIKEAIQGLWKQQLIKDVAIYASQVKEHGIILTIQITESPRLSDYSLEGIKRKEREKLIEKLPLVKGKVVTEGLIKKTKKIIQDYWIEKGYLYTAVTITSLPDPTQAGHVQLTIKIDKGENLSIYAVHFAGNQHISSDVLRGQLQHLRAKPRFTLIKDMLKQMLTLKPIRQGGILWRPLNFEEINNYWQKHVILSSSKFNPAKFKEDKKHIIDYYQSQGFRDAAIVDEAVYQQDDGLLNVWIKLEEGTQYRVGAIRWVGNHLYNDDTLSQILGIQEGDIYNPSLLQQKLYGGNPKHKDIAALYMDNGHLFFQAEPVEVGLEEDKVALDIRIQEGPQASINKVSIAGNTWTHDEVIRRELRTLPGDKFNRAKLQRSYRELVMLNIFDPSIHPDILPNIADNTVDIRYNVKENPNIRINATGGGAADDLKLKGRLILFTNNFSLGNLFRRRLPLGAAQTFGLTAETDFREYNFGLQFVEPWLGGVKPRQFYLNLDKSFEGNRVSTGGRLGLSTRLTWPVDYTVLRGNIAYYRHYYKDYDLLDVGKKSAIGTLNDLSTVFSLDRNSTDNLIYPKEGSKLELHLKLTPPWSSFSNSLSWPEGHCFKEYHQ